MFSLVTMPLRFLPKDCQSFIYLPGSFFKSTPVPKSSFRSIHTKFCLRIGTVKFCKYLLFPFAVVNYGSFSRAKVFGQQKWPFHFCPQRFPSCPINVPRGICLRLSDRTLWTAFICSLAELGGTWLCHGQNDPKRSRLSHCFGDSRAKVEMLRSQPELLDD